MSCQGKQCGSCGGCGGCGSCGGTLMMTAGELEMLEQLAQTPFLPVTEQKGVPIYLEQTARSREEYSAILSALALKGLISLDYDQPLLNFDYRNYGAAAAHGSAALTLLGQQTIDLLQLQGVLQE